MGRKRKTRWRHLSIGEVSGNEEEDDETTQQAQGEGSSSSEFPSYGYRHHKSHSLNSIHRHRSASLTFKDRDRGFGDSTPAGRFNSKMSSASSVTEKTAATNGYLGGKDGVSAKDKDAGGDKGEKDDGAQSGDSEVKESGSGGGGDVPNHNHRQQSPYNNHYSSHRHGYNNPHQYHNGYHHHSSYDKDGAGGSGGSRPYQNGHGEYSGSNNYYHRSNSYNNYRNSHYEGHHGGRGGGGGSDYHFPSRYGERGGGGGFRGRIRRSYSSYNSYYGSGNGNGGQQANGEGNPNTPSYNQEEYTKITTPRQDVLFKKGYLSQRKSAAQSSSLESTSTPTTPSASTNGTPDTHSTAGINSDYSEGYENGETDGGGGGGASGGATVTHPPPYVGADDTVYYGPPAETAVFTDPHTGQVYYGQCSSTGEFFDAYPVSPVMLACPNGQGGIFYQLAYPPPLDWNGVPQLFPLAVAPPMPPAPLAGGEEGGMLHGGSGVSSAAVQGSGSEISDSIAKNISKIKEFRPAASSASAPTSATSTSTNASSGASSTSTNSDASGSGSTEVPASAAEESAANSSDSKSQSAGNNNNKNYSSNNNTTTTSKQAMAMNSLSAQMSNLNVNGSHAPFNGHGHQHQPALPPAPSHPAHLSQIPNYMASVPVHHQHQHQHQHPHHHQPPPPHAHLPPHQAGGVPGGPPPTTSPYFAVAAHPHPGFVYAAPPIYNGVVVPIAPPASSSATATATPAASCSRKKRKKRRRNTETEAGYEANDQNDDDDDAQLTDESYEGSDGGEVEPEATPDDSPYANDDEREHTKPKPYLIDPNNPSSELEQEINQNPTDSNLGLSPCTINNNATTDIKGKKPSNLSGLCPLTGESTQDPFCLQISPTTLEPSSPDSFNTTQSVAGSEIVGSVSDDLMNRTTSIDEVEEDLPIEDDNENGRALSSSSSSPLKQEKLHAQLQPQQQQQTAASTIDSTTSNPNPNPVPGSSPITISKSESHSQSPTFPSGSGANEPSPSPESTFERQIEPPAAETPLSADEPCENEKCVRIPLESLYPTPELQLEEKVEEEQLAELDVKTQNYNYAASLLESQDLHPLDRVHVQNAPIILKRERDEPKPKESSPAPPEQREQSITSTSVGIQAEKVEQPSTSSAAASASAAVERPKSITLAVTEWLKTAGEDALSPAAQIVAQFKSAAAAAIAAEDNDGDGDIDSEDEEGERELQREGDRDRQDGQSLTDSEENQKNAYGNPWVLVSSSKRNRKAAVNTTTRNQRHANSSHSYSRNNWQGRQQQQQRPYNYSNSNQQQREREQQQQESSAGLSRRDSRERDYQPAKNGPNPASGTRRDGTSSRVASSSSYHNYNSNSNYGHNSNTHRNYYNRGQGQGQSRGYGRDKFSNSAGAASLSLNLGERQHERAITRSACAAGEAEDTISSITANAGESESNTNSTRKSTAQTAPHVKVDEEDSGLDLSSPEHHTAQPAAGAPVFPDASPNSGTSSGKQEEGAIRPRPTAGASKKKRKGNSNKQITVKTSAMDDEEKSGTQKNVDLMSSSSIEEGTSPPVTDSEPINCDPQNYAKYYQFGVVLEGEGAGELEAQEEEEDMKDHGIESGSSTPNSTTPPQTPKLGDEEQTGQAPVLKSGKKKKKKKNQSALLSLSLGEQERQSFISMSTAPVDMSKVIKTCDFYETRMSVLMKSKNKVTAAPPIAVQEEDEEIGTFDPDNLKSPGSQRSSRVVLWKGAGRQAQSAESSTPPEINEEDYKEFVLSVMKKNASSSTGGAPNLYVNPLSLAAELVSAANASKVKLPDSWDVPEPPLPDYESPPPPNLNLLNYNYPPAYSPVFSHLTPREKLIRTQLTPYGFPSASTAAAGSGNPVSTLMTPATQQAVCCNIQ